jgi:hypothetical protein
MKLPPAPIHPVDALKLYAPDLSPEQEAQLRALCDELITEDLVKCGKEAADAVARGDVKGE